MKTYYEVLGVSREATQQEIKIAFRKLVYQFHPDRNPNPAASEKIREINVAYDTLGDQQKREAYDYKLNLGWVEILESEPLHKDPYFQKRGRRANHRAENVESDFEMIKRYHPKLIYICYIGIIITLGLLVDTVLSPQAVKEKILRFNYNNYKEIITTTGHRVYDPGRFDWSKEEFIIIKYSRIFSIPIEIADETKTYRVSLRHNIFGSLSFFPILLFVSSVLAFFYRKKVGFSFNLTVVSAILLFLNLFLIFHP